MNKLNIIPEDDSVRLLYDITEDLNYRELHRVYSEMGRNPVVAPESLFRLSFGRKQLINLKQNYKRKLRMLCLK